MVNIVSGPCAVCNKDSQLRCAGCNNGPFYCSKEHQKNDWKNNHRFSCGTNALEANPDPDYGVIYKAKRAIPSGTVLFTRKPIVSFPRRFSPFDLVTTPYNSLFRFLESMEPLRNEDIVACLDCSGMMPYKRFVMDETHLARFHCCPRCEWPIHCNPCGSAHDEECTILNVNKVKWDDYKFVGDVYFLIGVLRAVLLKRNSNPAFKTLISMPSKMIDKLRPIMGLLPNFIIEKCKLGSVITLAELTKLFEVISSNFLTCNHRPSYDTRYAMIVFAGASGRVLPHSCMENCTVTIDPKTLIGTFTTNRAVEVGEKLTINYDPLLTDQGPLRGSKSRLDFLREINVKCDCARCNTCDENGTMFNAIRCRSEICEKEEHYILPILQTPDDCPNECQNPKCKQRVNQDIIRKIQIDVQLINAQAEKCVGLIRMSLPAILKKLHPNHFLVLRAKLSICLLAAKMIFPVSQYYEDSKQTDLKLSAFVYHKSFLEDFAHILSMFRLLRGDISGNGGPPSLLLPYALIRVSKLADEFRTNPENTLETLALELEEVHAQVEDAMTSFRNDPMQTPDETKAYEPLRRAYEQLLFKEVVPKITSWDDSPPIFKKFFKNIFT